LANSGALTGCQSTRIDRAGWFAINPPADPSKQGS
jgi:hypothetical protein